MAFVVNDLVWFKVRGRTPYVSGDPLNAATPVAALLGGRGKPTIGVSQKATSGLRAEQGVPSIDATTFPPPLTSKDAVDNTTDVVDGEDKLGVTEQINQNNPLAPRTVETNGVFGPPTSENLFNADLDSDGSPIDEGRVDTVDKEYVNTIRTIDPSYPSGRGNGVAKASGDAINLSGSHEFASETIDLKDTAKRVGLRQPSSEEGAGTVVHVVTVKNAGKTSDGTPVKAGDKMYWVNWGTSNPSNPHRVKHNNRFRVQLHAEADLVAAP